MLEKLIEIQKKMASKVVLRDIYKLDEIEYVLGVDQAFVGDLVLSACVKLSFPELEFVESEIGVSKVEMPYIPTFLMFREGKPAVNVVKKLVKKNERSVVLVDGSGIAHPRRCGLATYIGLKLEIPSIGITKKKLYGRVEEPRKTLESSPIYDDGEIIGFALKTCRNCRPIYISPGHLISTGSSLEVVKLCLRKRKLPEPIRLAHEVVTNKKSTLYPRV